MRVTTTESAALDELFQVLGGAPSFLAVYTTSPDGMERCAASLAADSRFALTAIQGCTSCMGAVASGGGNGQQDGTVMFGLKDHQGAYCCAAKQLDADELNDEQSWFDEAANMLQEGMDALKSSDKDARPLVLLHATSGYEEKVLEAIQTIIPGAQVFGGSAADSKMEPSEWRLLSGAKTFGNSAIAICLMWPSVPYSLSLNCLHGEPPPEAAVGQVGQVANGGRLLVELDGRPAAATYDEWSNKPDGESLDVLNTRTTLQPLARKVMDVDGKTVRYFPLHPQIRPDGDQSIGLFASAKVNESLVCLQATHQGIIDAVGTAVTRSSSATKRASGALAIYCAGCAMELERQVDCAGSAMGQIETMISKSLPKECPFVGCFTFGEQGPLLTKDGLPDSVHANLMFNLLVFDTN